MLWAEKTARNRKKQQIFQSKDEILNKMGRENSQTVQFWRIFSAYNSYNAYDVEVKRYFDLYDIYGIYDNELLRTEEKDSCMKNLEIKNIWKWRLV